MIVEYQGLIEEILDPASGTDYQTQVQIAESAMGIRGYGPIKEAAIERWRGRVIELRRECGLRVAGT